MEQPAEVCRVNGLVVHEDGTFVTEDDRDIVLRWVWRERPCSMVLRGHDARLSCLIGTIPSSAEDIERRKALLLALRDGTMPVAEGCEALLDPAHRVWVVKRERILGPLDAVRLLARMTTFSVDTDIIIDNI